MQTTTEAIQNYEDEYFRNRGQDEARYGKYKYLKLEEVKLTITMNKLPVQFKHINILLSRIWSEDGRVSVDRPGLLTKNRDVLASKKIVLDGYSCNGRKWDLNMVWSQTGARGQGGLTTDQQMRRDWDLGSYFKGLMRQFLATYSESVSLSFVSEHSGGRVEPSQVQPQHLS